MTATASIPPVPFHVLAKPIGPICNLDCKYCFYLEKENLYPDERRWKMPDDVLETFIRQYIEQSPAPEVSFAWQGGEPTLLGVEFFRKVVALQKKHAAGRKISNGFQTNGVLLDDAWCRFLTENDFLIGISIDGPQELHDRWRVDKQGRPTFDAVMRGLECLKKHNTQFNTLTVVHRQNSQKPLEIYRFLKSIGSHYIQFIPLVEREPTVQVKIKGMDFAEPPSEQNAEPSPVTAWSVEARAFGQFLIQIFDEWVRKDVGQYFVQMFDVALGNWMGMGSSLCIFAERCGAAVAIEHNGDLYSCDHYVYPKYHLGNVMQQTLGEMLTSPAQRKFGNDKADTLPKYCRECEVRFACHGECPKHRFIHTPDGEAGLNYLCGAYRPFFNHIDPYMKIMCDLLRREQAPASIMQMLAQREQTRAAQPAVGRNEACPCGSGKKYKKCCGVDQL